MSTWIPITEKLPTAGVVVGVRGYIDNDKSKGCWYEMMVFNDNHRFQTQSGILWDSVKRTPVEFLELPYDPTPVEKFCDQFFPVLWENVRGFARTEDRRKRAVQLVFDTFAALEGHRPCDGVIMTHCGERVSGNIHGHWTKWVQKNHPEEMRPE